MAIARWTIVGVALLAGVAVAGESPALKDETDKRSYALGMAFGSQLRTQSVEIDLDLYQQGLKDALAGGKTLLTEAEVRAAVHLLQVELKQKKRAQQGEKRVAAAPAAGVEVSFKLDPRLTKGLYMGERWVSGATYSSATAPEGEAITVEARARGAGPGAAGKIAPRWIASNPEIVTISPSEGGEVTLTVRPAGESTVTVKHGERSSVFTVKPVRQGDQWRVELSKAQQPPHGGAVTAASNGSVAERQER